MMHVKYNASLQLCAGYRVKTEAPVWDYRLAPVLMGLLDLNVKPVSSHITCFPTFSESICFEKVITLPVMIVINIVFGGS